MAKKYWLFKSEPGEFSITELKNSPNQTTYWDGVRNYQARNFMRDDMQVGDSVLFYHSVKNPSIVGLAKVVKTGYPDHTALDKNSRYFYPKSTPENPVWYMVDIQFEREFAKPLTLAELREVPGLEQMSLLQKGNRLSIQPVTEDEFEIVMGLADGLR